MALLSNYYVNGTSGSDSNDGTSGSPFATHQHAVDTIATESSNDLTSPASGVVTIHWVAGNVGANASMTGITDDASNYIVVQGGTHSSKGQWDTGSPYIEATATDGLENTLNYTRLYNVQIYVGGGEYENGFSNTGTNIIFESGVIRGLDDGITNNRIGIVNNNASGTCYYRKVFIYGMESSTGYCHGFRQNAAGTCELQNCGQYGDEATAGYLYGIRRSLGTLNVTNCYSKADGPYHGTVTVTTSAAHNADGNPANLDNIALNTTYYVDPNNATSTSRDFSLVASTVISDGTESTDLSAQFTTDFLGNTISTWPIGPIEYVSGAGPTGRIMSSLTNHGGLAGHGGIAGIGGGLAG